MRKLIVIIIVLIIILGGMIAYKNIVKKVDTISVQEIEKIENYLNQIYIWQEITEEALPKFEEINQANEKWIWEAVKKNLEEYELSYEQIQEKVNIIFKIPIFENSNLHWRRCSAFRPPALRRNTPRAAVPGRRKPSVWRCVRTQRIIGLS